MQVILKDVCPISKPICKRGCVRWRELLIFKFKNEYYSWTCIPNLTSPNLTLPNLT